MLVILTKVWTVFFCQRPPVEKTIVGDLERLQMCLTTFQVTIQCTSIPFVFVFIGCVMIGHLWNEMPTSKPRRKPHGQNKEWGNQAEASSSYHHLWWSIHRRLKWFGHVVRMPPHRLPFQAYKNYFLKRRPPGRPPARWRDQNERDMGVPLKEAEHQAQGRPEWRRITRRRGKGHTVLCS